MFHIFIRTVQLRVRQKVAGAAAEGVTISAQEQKRHQFQVGKAI